MNHRTSESEWIALRGKSFGDDQQAMRYAQLTDILRGNLDMQINDDHVQAYLAESAPLYNFIEGF